MTVQRQHRRQHTKIGLLYLFVAVHWLTQLSIAFIAYRTFEISAVCTNCADLCQWPTNRWGNPHLILVDNLRKHEVEQSHHSYNRGDHLPRTTSNDHRCVQISRRIHTFWELESTMERAANSTCLSLNKHRVRPVFEIVGG